VEPVLLRIQKTATLLKVSMWTIYRWIVEGRMRATKIGRAVCGCFEHR
jgi:excisionase family DNA binding protein